MGLGSEELGECMLRQGAADPEQGAAMGIPTGTEELALGAWVPAQGWMLCSRLGHMPGFHVARYFCHAHEIWGFNG